MDVLVISVGMVVVAGFQALLAYAATRSRAYGQFKEFTLTVDKLEADIAFLSDRLTKMQKRQAAETSVEARRDAKSLKDEAEAHLMDNKGLGAVPVRPSVFSGR